MTSRDFRLIADTISGMTSEFDRSGIEYLAEKFANALAGTNDHFDRARFIRAAEGNPKAGDKPRTSDYRKNWVVSP
jgi:hypothetical protein